MIEAGRFTIEADHPALPGHFPGNPVVPGVMLLDRAAAAILAVHPGWRLGGLPQVKFLRPVRPGDAITITHQPGGPCVPFCCRCGDDEVLRGTLVLDPDP